MTSPNAEAGPSSSSFPLYPAPSPSLPSSSSPRQTYESDLALLQSISTKGKGKGKGRALKSPSDLPPTESLLAEAKQRLSKRTTQDVPEYDEEELRAFYAAVVQSGAEGGEGDWADRNGVMRRIGAGEGDIESRGRIGAGGGSSGINEGLGGLDGMTGERVREMLAQALRRLAGPQGAEERGIGSSGDLEAEGSSAISDPVPHRSMDRLNASTSSSGDAILAQLAQAVSPSTASLNARSSAGVKVSLGLLTKLEWKALLADRIQSADFHGLVQTLRCMEQCSLDVQATALLGELLSYSTDLLAAVPEEHRPRGGVEMNERLAGLLAAQKPANLSPSDHTSLITSYLLSPSPQSTSRAISHLSHSASLGLPAPQSAYALVLSSLISTLPSAPRRALAWDLFADMRLTAHPTPSMEVYRTMMLACSAAAEPKPEQARDLWVEMQEAYARGGAGLQGGAKESEGEAGRGAGMGDRQPGVREYTAFIRALGSTKGTYLEAFEVMRQMLARHEEASYTPFDHPHSSFDADPDASEGAKFRLTKWTPTKETWKALLEGTKRAGDVERSKWVLLEAAHWAEKTGEEMMDEDMVAAVLMAYAAFVPRRTRVGLGIKKEGRGEVGEGETSAGNEEGNEASGEEIAVATLMEGHGRSQDRPDAESRGQMDGPEERRVMKQLPIGGAPLQATLTAAQAIAEARGVFDLVRSRSQLQPPPDPANAEQSYYDDTTHNVTQRADATFRITPRLINSFLSVSYAHAPSIEACRTEWRDIWSSFGHAAGAGSKGEGRAGVRARPNGWSYLHALERCAVGQRHFSGTHSGDAGVERKAALEWAEELWSEYMAAFPPTSTKLPAGSQSDTHVEYNIGIGPRQIERAWTAIIRTHAVSSSIPTSLALLLEFERLYPASDLTNLSTIPSRPSHPAFKIRFSDPTTILDTDTPPHLLWKDVDVLHQRMVRDGDAKGVGKVKMVTMGYLRGLRERAAMRRREGRGKEAKRVKALREADGVER